MKTATTILRLMGLAALAGPGCLGPLDVLGQETLVTESEALHKEAKIEDDRIEDKHPVFEVGREVVESFGECELTLNKSGSVTKLDVLPFEGAAEAALAGRLFRGRAEAIAAVDGGQGAAGLDLIPSMEIVSGAMKPFNDGLYAALEIALQEGREGLVPSKRQLLADLVAATRARWEAATPVAAAHLERAMVFVAAAILAAGGAVDLPAGPLAEAQAQAQLFLLGSPFARPVGFYTWGAEARILAEIFVQDRFLQNLDSDDTDAEFGLVAALAVVLGEEPELLARYEQVLALYAGLTNPYASYSAATLVPYVDAGVAALEDVGALRAEFRAAHGEPFACTRSWYAVLPASRSKDTAYFNSRWCGVPYPAGVSLIDELIGAIRMQRASATVTACCWSRRGSSSSARGA